MATQADKVERIGIERRVVGQTRVVEALILRELHTRYGRENIGYLWLILEPMLLASMIALIHARGHNINSGDIKPVPLSLIGYCNFMTFRSIFNRAEGAIEQNVALLYHRNIRPFQILVARSILEAAGTWAAFIILMGMAIMLGLANFAARPLYYVSGMFSMLLLATGGAFLICGITHERKAIGRMVHPFTYIMMPLSGAFFTMDMLPRPAREVLLWIPLAHIFELLRYGWFRAATPEYFSMLYVFCWILGLWLFGLLFLAQARRNIHMP